MPDSGTPEQDEFFSGVSSDVLMESVPFHFPKSESDAAALHPQILRTEVGNLVGSTHRRVIMNFLNSYMEPKF